MYVCVFTPRVPLLLETQRIRPHPHHFRSLGNFSRLSTSSSSREMDYKRNQLLKLSRWIISSNVEDVDDPSRCLFHYSLDQQSRCQSFRKDWPSVIDLLYFDDTYLRYFGHYFGVDDKTRRTRRHILCAIYHLWKGVSWRTKCLFWSIAVRDNFNNYF